MTITYENTVMVVMVPGDKESLKPRLSRIGWRPFAHSRETRPEVECPLEMIQLHQSATGTLQIRHGRYGDVSIKALEECGPMKYLRPYSHYAKLYGRSESRIKKWEQRGRRKNDLCPLDTPTLMPAWCARNLRSVPDGVLRYGADNGTSLREELPALGAQTPRERLAWLSQNTARLQQQCDQFISAGDIYKSSLVSKNLVPLLKELRELEESLGEREPQTPRTPTEQRRFRSAAAEFAEHLREMREDTGSRFRRRLFHAFGKIDKQAKENDALADGQAILTVSESAYTDAAVAAYISDRQSEEGLFANFSAALEEARPDEWSRFIQVASAIPRHLLAQIIRDFDKETNNEKEKDICQNQKDQKNSSGS